ncbi:MAG: IMPACT family protein [Oscillospiraceae bacterium]
MENYRTLAARGTATIEEKKSEFIGVAAPATTEEEALAVLQEIKAAHRTARHNVYAYLLGEGNRTRCSDDGEPAKTAGVPILNVLQHSDITDCIIVVTRYFGGTLLGTGGLVRAYTSAAKAALDAADIRIMQVCVTICLTVGYALYEPCRKILEEGTAVVQEPVFTDAVAITATVAQPLALGLQAQLNELCRGSVKIDISAPFFAPV